MEKTNEINGTNKVRPTLLILAAGMGSRYGGIKQIENMGRHDELIIDFSIFDAIRAGFDKVVFVIRKDIEQDFCEQIFNRIKDVIPAQYVFQDKPDWRKKPLGTTHAILAAKDVIDTPFCVINADDFYGSEAYRVITDYFANHDIADNEHAMVGYKLKNTLSDNGGVTRGVVYVDENNYVVRISETKGMEKRGQLMGYQFQDNFIEFEPDTNVSMTFFGFTPEIFPLIEAKFEQFKLLNIGNQDAECIIAETCGELINEGKITLKMFESHDKWYGVTYKQDKDEVKSAIENMTKAGKYPSPLWNNTVEVNMAQTIKV